MNYPTTCHRSDNNHRWVDFICGLMVLSLNKNYLQQLVQQCMLLCDCEVTGPSRRSVLLSQRESLPLYALVTGPFSGPLPSGNAIVHRLPTFVISTTVRSDEELIASFNEFLSRSYYPYFLRWSNKSKLLFLKSLKANMVFSKK